MTLVIAPMRVNIYIYIYILLADLFLYTYENEFWEKLIEQKKFTLAKKFNYCFRYIDDLICLNHSTFEKHLSKIYPSELTVKRENGASDRYASYLFLSLNLRDDNILYTKLYDKRDDFKFPIVNFSRREISYRKFLNYSELFHN